MGNARSLHGLTMGTIKTGLIKGTTSSYTTTVTSAGMINGKYVTGLAAQTNTATPTTDAMTGLAFPALAANEATVLVIGQKADSTIQMLQGSIVPTVTGVTTTAGAFINAPQFPALPDDFMVFGYALVRTSPTGSAFTAGTTEWAASGITTSQFVQCGVLPDRPVTA
ncbi:MAG: hypothetical protein WC710_14945 [Gallionella sp.]